MGGEGGAGDLRGLDAHVQQALGDVGGDEGDQLAVGFHAALGQELLQIKAAVDFHLVDGAILVAVVPGTDLLQAGQGS